MPYPHRIAVTVLGGLLALLVLYQLSKSEHVANLHYSRLAGSTAGSTLNETLGFSKIFAINLPSRSDRRDAMSLAAAVTGLRLDWIAGWAGKDVLEKALPADSADQSILEGNKGSWRAHMDALRTVVEQNLTNALILEDDADWDVRLKSQMHRFAESSRIYLQALGSESTHVLGGVPSFATDPTLREYSIADFRSSLDPTVSPFGDDWDVLWLGHCGTEFPRHPPSLESGRDPPLSKLASSSPAQLPLVRILYPGDETVPVREHLRPHPLAGPDALAAHYPDHTRVTHASSGTVCTIGYAVSQRGARRLLWQFGLETFTSGWDLMLRDWCDGMYTENPAGTKSTSSTKGGEDRSRKAPVCLTVQPPLFSHHYGKGGSSDITAPGGGFISKEKESSPYIRLSARLNMGKLVDGYMIMDLLDQWPDSAAP